MTDGVLYTYKGFIEREELQHSRRVVSNWIDTDNHGLIIPNTPWGRELLVSLGNLMAATQKDFEIKENSDGLDPATR